jgi:benzoyl-CoA reductase/2-hydroxyglutaryl-CoA dehydratase subunit BcrC/BadD/HgdB
MYQKYILVSCPFIKYNLRYLNIVKQHVRSCCFLINLYGGSTMNDLPNMFNDFSEARKKGFIDIKELKDAGKKVVGTYCVFTPDELILSAGAIPISLCGMSEEPISEAERHLPRNLCPLIKSSYGFAITDTCPYFYFSDILIGETTCDGKKKMYEYLGEIKPIHVMQLPQNSCVEDSLWLWRKEIVRLKERLEKEFSVKITDENLKAAIKLKNRQRKAIRDFYELGKLTPPPLSGLEMLQVLYGSTFKTDKEEHIKTLKTLTEELKENDMKGVTKISKNAKRILITGCPIGGATEKIVKAIEENGGVVVCFENCSGVKSNDKLVDESKDSIDAIAEKYLGIPCSCMSPNDGRVELISRLIREYKIDGVVDVILQACHTYNVETYKIKRYLKEKVETPYMSIETDYSQADIGQLNTRMAAFIEML